MMTKEIGSEFWRSETGAEYRLPGKTYLSGRAALSAIILDLQKRGVTCVGLPDYLCESMIEPFLRRDMNVGFYSVGMNHNGLTIAADILQPFGAVLLVNYFGMMARQINALADECKHMGISVIRDLTHDVFTDAAPCQADYTFGSYRKWTGVELGFASGDCASDLTTWPISEDGIQYLALRDKARNIKHRFVDGGYEDETLRHTQLELFEKAEELLDREYISDTDECNKSRLSSLDADDIAKKRQENARALYGDFKHLKICIPMFSEMPDDAVPLAVPVLIPQEKRNALRSYLREHGIFCPVHWPVSSLHKAGSDACRIYNSEISLVCDQRYGTEDMTRTMEMIKQWEKITSE